MGKRDDTFDSNIFLRPGAAYRAAPFWAWNGKLKAGELKREIDAFHKMGLGGFHMHPRFGLNTCYLGKTFLKMVRVCVEHAKKKGMLARLYDEDRWPSGFGGGEITKNPAYRAKNVLLTDTPREAAALPQSAEEEARCYNAGRGYLLARYSVKTDRAGKLVSHRLLARGEKGENERYLYVLTEPASDWYNGEAYVDVMNKEAIAAFIAYTHEKFYRALKDDFGKTVPSIFSDEPMFSNIEPGSIAWTGALQGAYRERYGEDILLGMPELFFDLSGGRRSEFCARYYDLCAELFRGAFAKQIGDWCGEHGLDFTGHYMEEDSIDGQIRRSGSLMRQYLHYAVPGIDMLCDFREYHTAKQAQSVVRQGGKRGMMCECYGSTRYEFDFRKMKLQGDWLAACGITLRVPHLSWYTMEGLGKRDYPPNFGYQAPWAEKFPLIEDHFARVNVAMTRGEPVVHIAVVHPVESGWLMQRAERFALNDKFLRLNGLLLGRQFDFDYIDEQLLSELCPQGGNPLRVGEAKYGAVVVADCTTLRSSTIERLESFARAGGELIFCGEIPSLADAQPSERPRRLAEGRYAYSDGELLSRLEPFREVSVERENKGTGVDYLYQLRKEGAREWLFIAHADMPVCESETVTVVKRGAYTAERVDTFTGKMSPLEVIRTGGDTRIAVTMHKHDSLLVCLHEEVER